MRILTEKISNEELLNMLGNPFDSIVKGVVDVDKEILCIDGELHADLETFLLEKGSEQSNLWGINLHPMKEDGEFVEFDSIINIRPRQNNRSRYVQSEELRNKILTIVDKWIM